MTERKAGDREKQMAATPRLKVFTAGNEYVAACKYAKDAAALVALYGDKSTIRDGHAYKDAVWAEGIDGKAAESYDHVASVVYARIDARRAALAAQSAAASATANALHAPVAERARAILAKLP